MLYSFVLLLALFCILGLSEAFKLSMMARGPQTNKLNAAPTPKFNPAAAKKAAKAAEPEKKLKTGGIGGFIPIQRDNFFSSCCLLMLYESLFTL